MNIRRLTTTALVVGSAALVSAGVFVGASLTDDDNTTPIAPIAVPAQATTAPEQPGQANSTERGQRPSSDRREQRVPRATAAPSQPAPQTTTSTPAIAGVAVVDGDADVFGDQVRLEAETTQAAQRVEFIYGGARYTAELIETDVEDATKEWGATVPSLAADRTPGETLEFQVEACDNECVDAQITELVEFDD